MPSPVRETVSPRKILWAVDPFCEECPLMKQTACAVATLASQWGAEVEPIYLLGDVPANARLIPSLLSDVQIQAQNELRHLLKDIHIPQLRDLRFIADPGSQLREQSDQLVEYAKNTKASLIAIGTRARKGPRRWLLGSFAETLILHSDVPLFVVNPHEDTPSKFDPILFPTDFSTESEQAYRQVVELALEMKAGLTLFHKIKYDLTPSVEVAFSAYPAYKNYFEEEVQARQHDASEWAKVAQAAGVQAETVVDYRMSGSVSQAILNRSQNRGGMIAMAAHSGPITSALLGSTTRQVVRSAKCAVWIVHPTQAKGRGRKAA